MTTYQAVTGDPWHALAGGTRRAIVERLDPMGIGAMRADLDRFWTQALASFKHAVEDPVNPAEPMEEDT